ncbi:not available [Yersinia enterocolitica]|nr:not available [Yersinia enterocolitica]
MAKYEDIAQSLWEISHKGVKVIQINIREAEGDIPKIIPSKQYFSCW